MTPECHKRQEGGGECSCGEGRRRLSMFLDLVVCFVHEPTCECAT